MSTLLEFFDQEVQVQPPVVFSVLVIQRLNVHALAHRYPLIKEDHSFFCGESVHRVLDFDINLELHDFLQFPDVDVVTHVESEEETAHMSLGVNHLRVD